MLTVVDFEVEQWIVSTGRCTDALERTEQYCNLTE